MKELIKKIGLLVVVCLLLVPVQAPAQTVISSGMTTTDRLIAMGACEYYGMAIISGASTASVVIYDAITISGTSIDRGFCPTAQGNCKWMLPYGVQVFNGIYADVTGTGANYTVFYNCK
ncbi:MAG TPA: hypothetical protein VLH56_17295 [Dissulfurispiraceae bacterium]|nr:hypothetical protein [Dissulfurispiraceae bacterium]